MNTGTCISCQHVMPMNYLKFTRKGWQCKARRGCIFRMLNPLNMWSNS